MGKVLEQHAKALLTRSRIPTPRGEAAKSPNEARQIAEQIGAPVVVKALVLAGKRGKAGAVCMAATPQDAAHAAGDLLGSEVGGYPVHQVLVEEQIAVQRELYLSLTIDPNAACTRLLISATGGIEIEEIAQDNPNALQSLAISPSTGLAEFEARQLWHQAGITGRLLPRLGTLTARIYRTFRDLDAYLLEINPLAETENGDLVALGAVLAVDDAALYRQPVLDGLVQVASEKVWRPLTPREEQVNALNAAEPYRGSARYLELDGGDIGFLCGGGGASLVLFDSLVRAGGQPANYAEFGGNPTETKVAGLARVVLSKPGVRGLFVAHNITNNTQVDVVARGVVQALHEANISTDRFPVVAREIGLHDAEGRAIFEAAGIRYYGIESTLSDAARGMVADMHARDERVSS